MTRTDAMLKHRAGQARHQRKESPPMMTNAEYDLPRQESSR